MPSDPNRAGEAVRVRSLCTGYGGLDDAVLQVIGGELAWYAEIDTHAARLLAEDYPDVPNLGDITIADWMQTAPVDVLTAGYPCQPFSSLPTAVSRRGETP